LPFLAAFSSCAATWNSSPYAAARALATNAKATAAKNADNLLKIPLYKRNYTKNRKVVSIQDCTRFGANYRNDHSSHYLLPANADTAFPAEINNLQRREKQI
jgi:uncharacterized protein (DUF2147 family)